MKKVLFLLMMLFASTMSVQAQTYCYKYLYNVNGDGIKTKGRFNSGKIFYFTFTNNEEWVYQTDQNGYYGWSYGMESYRYVGRKNGMRIYKEQSQNAFHKPGMLYISDDLKKMNIWCDYENFNGGNNLMVLRYVSDPDEDDTPSQLY